jgi:hypothetical protein
MNKLNIFKKIELVIFYPHKFFDKIQKENNFLEVFKFYLFFVFLSIAINVLFILPEFIKSKLNMPFLSYLALIMILIIFILLLVFLTALSSFVFYYIYHIIIKLFNGKKRYQETYKLLYASTPLLIVSLIPFYNFFKLIFYPLFILAALDTIYIEFIGLQKLQKMNKENAIAVIIIILIIGIIALIFLMKGGLIWG